VDEFGKIFAWEQKSQIQIHTEFGGVVPEVASRYHEKTLFELCSKALEKIDKDEIKFVAATSGPGLIGPLLVGRCFAEGLARGLGVPFRGVHHLRGHVASVLIENVEDPRSLVKQRAEEIFPALVLLVSGGHTQILQSDSSLNMKLLADTADDSAGECFDKIAKLLGLGYPGGPAIEKKALECVDAESRMRAQKIMDLLPRPKSEEGFSFSGLKTAARLYLEKNKDNLDLQAFCFAIQEVIADSLKRGIERAVKKLPSQDNFKSLVFCGGVSANARIREVLSQRANKMKLKALFPPLKLCTDNAVMIAHAMIVQSPAHDLKDVQARVTLT
jgi:N6-L-threonylcarbamoyladenine synthase